MGLGALEARWERAFKEPKIIQIGLQIFAGDDFEKIFLAKNFENVPVHGQHDIVLKINRNNSFILDISMKCQ